MRTAVITLACLIATAPAHADQVQADFGLTVVDVAYEHSFGERVALAGEAGIFGTYFLPWFDRGPDTKGLDLALRATWFARDGQEGLYVTPYVRGALVRGDADATGSAVTAGAFVGWALRLTGKLDLRLGLGAQYIYITGDTLSASTPFLAIDGLLGYRL